MEKLSKTQIIIYLMGVIVASVTWWVKKIDAKTDENTVAIVEVKSDVKYIREDTQEIKETQKAMWNHLRTRR